MRAVLQRVTSASVTVDGVPIARIGAGLLALVGVTHTDTEAQAGTLARRVAELRLFDGGRSSVADLGLEVLVVSQFTLYADLGKGRRPSWSAAAPGPAAKPLLDAVVTALRGRGVRVHTGRFGAHMAVALVNDGPVTLIVEVVDTRTG